MVERQLDGELYEKTAVAMKPKPQPLGCGCYHYLDFSNAMVNFRMIKS